jgi:hypothetical protein
MYKDHLFFPKDTAGRRTTSPHPLENRIFRDYLAAHPDAARRYAVARRRAAGLHPDSRARYACVAVRVSSRSPAFVPAAPAGAYHGAGRLPIGPTPPNAPHEVDEWTSHAFSYRGLSRPAVIPNGHTWCFQRLDRVSTFRPERRPVTNPGPRAVGAYTRRHLVSSGSGRSDGEGANQTHVRRQSILGDRHGNTGLLYSARSPDPCETFRCTKRGSPPSFTAAPIL